MKTITSYFSKLFSKLVPISNTAGNAKVVEALHSMSVSLLIVGLITSWLAVAPFMFYSVARFTHPFFGWVACIGSCFMVSKMIDSKIGVFVPEFFANLFNGKGWINAAQTASLLFLSVGLSYITMSLSSYGGEMTVKMLFEVDKPETHSAGHAQMDSVKRAREGQIRELNSKDLTAAENKDKAIKAEAVAMVKNAEMLAAQQYPLWKTHEYHKQQYYKILTPAKTKAEQHSATAVFLENENSRLQLKISDMGKAIASEQEANEKALKHEWDEYHQRLRVANLFLSDLGFWATPLFWLITALTVLQTVPKGTKKKEPTKPEEPAQVVEAEAPNVRPFSTITKHLTQNLARLAEAIKENKPTSTYAKTILDIYEEAALNHKQEFEAMQIRHSSTFNSDGTPRYPVYKKEDVSLFQ